MPTKTTYLVTLALDEKWFQAIDNFTKNVYDGELCTWLSVMSRTLAIDTSTDRTTVGGEED